MTRKPFPDSVETAVLVACRRRCALCYFLNFDTTEKRGQLAHIDDPQDIEESNAAFLCLEHHALYDSTSKQAKGYTPSELKKYKEALLAYLAPMKIETAKPEGQAVQSARIGLDVYNLRIRVYRKARKFVREVCAKLRPDIPLILQFAWDTDEALFLFDDDLAEYLEILYKKALELYTVGLQREHASVRPEEAEEFRQSLEEHKKLALWFVDQPQEIRKRFAPFLRLG